MKACLFAIAVLALLHPANSAAQTTLPQLRIGVIGPLSGEARSFGEAIKNGVTLALEEQGDGLIEAVYEDDQFNNAKAVSAYRKLVSVDKVDVIFTAASGPSNAVAALAQADKMPMFAWASNPDVSRGRDFVFRSLVSGQREGDKAANEAVRLNYRRTAVYNVETDYAVSVRAGFLRSLPQERLVADETVAPTEMEFRSLLTRAAKSSPDSFFICLAPAQNAVFAKQARAMGLVGTFFGCGSLYNEENVRAADSALEGSWLVTVSSTDWFRERYIKRFATSDSLSGAVIQYDIANLLHELVKKGVPTNRIPEAVMKSGPRTGAIGRYEVREENGDRHFDITLVVKEITKQGFVDRR